MISKLADQFSLTVIQAGFSAAADEMFTLLRRTAMSPIIHEVLDAGTGITDGDGNLLGSGAGIPTFVGVLDKAVRRILDIHGRNSIAEGDIFITNDPYFGGVTHLSDVVVAKPVFHDGSCIAWTASIAHWSDIGGMTPGSMSTRATEIFQEGIRLPAVRLFAAGLRVQSLCDLIESNTRLPEFALGDLWAQVAASRRAANRIENLACKYGIEAFEEAIAMLFAEGERRALQGLSNLPRGTFRITEEQDSGAVWKAVIHVSEKEFVVDLRDNPAQVAAPYNTSRDGAVISAQMVFKAVADPERFANEGSFRPLKVLTRPGSIFHATEPAPHGYYFETRIRLVDLLWRCMSDTFPGLLPAGHFGSICGTVIAGVNPDTGRQYTMVEPQMGGWGATSRRPGLDCMYSTNHGETLNCPVEICEARYGIDVEWKRMNDIELGNSLHEGGRGISISYRSRSDAVLAAGFSRSRIRVWGSNGGSEGGLNRISVVRQNGRREDYAFVSDLAISPGDRILIETGNGGGWGRKTKGCNQPKANSR